MKSQTERPPRRPDNSRSTRSAKYSKSKHYSRQTARGFEAKRDGKPLIFGWGKHLSHSEKLRVQRIATWSFTGLVILIIVGVLVGSWIDTNIIIPGLTVTTVNGHQIPQSQLRKMVAFQTMVENNKIYGRNGLTAQSASLQQQAAAQLKIVTDTTNTINTLKGKIAKLPPGPSADRTSLENQLKVQQTLQSNAQAKNQSLTADLNNLTQNTIPLEQQVFTEAQIASQSASWLQEDELIREWLANQSAALQNQINPSSSAVTKAVNALAAGVPANTTYSSLLSQMSVSNDDMIAMMTISMRRDNMQTYLASKIVSPAYQVHARSMTIDTLAHAQAILKQLQANKGATFGQIAKQKSQDSATASSGGDLGWLIRGQYAQNEGTATVDNWLFDPARYIYQISPVLNENGTYRIVQILGIDPSRAVDSKTLQTAKGSALSNWLLELRADPSNVITTPDQNMLTDPNNLPPTSILPAAAPSSSNPTSPTGPTNPTSPTG